MFVVLLQDPKQLLCAFQFHVYTDLLYNPRPLLSPSSAYLHVAILKVASES